MVGVRGRLCLRRWYVSVSRREFLFESDHSHFNSVAVSFPQMSLLYNLFVESGTIPPESATRNFEFLCLAASHIVSSLADSNPDMGAQLAVRLLLPYAEDTEVVAAITNILEHYTPSSEQYARTLVNYCTPLIEKKSVQILQGCTGMLLHVHRQHMKQNKAVTATTFLLDGIELEALVLPEPVLGSCYRALAAGCHKVSIHLLQHIVAASQLDGSVDITARSMSQAFSLHKVETEKIPEAMELVHVLNIFDSFQSDKVAGREIGDRIIACL